MLNELLGILNHGEGRILMETKHLTYVVKYKNGQSITVTGRIVLFSTKTNTEIARHSNVIYLNAEEVFSVMEEKASQ